MMKKTLSLVAGVLLSGISFFALAQNATQVPGYTIHHNAMTTDTLTPKVAKAYGIQRSKNRGMLNVSVIKDQPGTTGVPVKAKVTATATNLTGQSRNIEMREVIDGDAIYYLADFRVTDQETLDFKLDVQPNDASTHFQTSLRQQFYTSE
jgi:hypothetical protein